MRQRRRRSPIVVPLLLIVAVGAIGIGWAYLRMGELGAVAPPNEAAGESRLTGEHTPSEAVIPEAVVISAPPPGGSTDEVLTPVGPGGSSDTVPNATTVALSEDTADDEPESAPQPAGREDDRAASPAEPPSRLSRNPRIDASLQRYEAGQIIEARQELNRMLAISRNADEQAELRRHLTKLADATIFSGQVRPDDPLVTTYTIQPGDMLLEVGRQFDLPYEVIMTINGIRDATRIRAGEKLKVPHGPFHARIHKSQFRLDVYLQDLYLRSFPVGLGATQETPEGVWKVKERLTNPTYYPPASATDKRRIAPDDPKNPLGEHWIGLEGIDGDALGREGYGIHGTIEPESIGKAVSLGCIRMHNDDVALLYQLMMRDRSTVTILP